MMTGLIDELNGTQLNLNGERDKDLKRMEDRKMMQDKREFMENTLNPMETINGILETHMGHHLVQSTNNRCRRLTDRRFGMFFLKNMLLVAI